MRTDEKMRKARAGLLLDNPFFGSLALRLKLVENTEKRIYTDDLLKQTAVDQVTAKMAEVSIDPQDFDF